MARMEVKYFIEYAIEGEAEPRVTGPEEIDMINALMLDIQSMEGALWAKMYSAVVTIVTKLEREWKP